MKQMPSSKKQPTLTKEIISLWKSNPVTIAFMAGVKDMKNRQRDPLSFVDLDKSCDHIAMMLAQARAINDTLEDITDDGTLEWIFEDHLEEVEEIEDEQREV